MASENKKDDDGSYEPKTGYTLTDPVMGCTIESDWIKRCADPLLPEKIASGRFVLLSDGTLLRRGLTTGTTAAAACKSAVISIVRDVEEVDVLTPCKVRVKMDVRASKGTSIALKDCGDHMMDATDKMTVIAIANPAIDTKLVFGKGIGMIARRGLCASMGKPAVSQSARKEIMNAISEGLEAAGLKGAHLELSVPEGENVALQTLNPSVGVIGGISILGSTGFVEPWNEHLGSSTEEDLKRLDRVVVTTGRIGLKFSRILFPNHQAVLLGSHLDRIGVVNGQDMIVCGLPGLILRWAWPEMLEGTGYATVAEMIESEPKHPAIGEALKRTTERISGARIVLIRRDGSIFADVGP